MSANKVLVTNSKIGLPSGLKNSIAFMEECQSMTKQSSDSKSPFRLPVDSSRNNLLSGKKMLKTSIPEKKVVQKKLTTMASIKGATNLNGLNMNSLNKFKQTIGATTSNVTGGVAGTNSNIAANKTGKNGMYQSFNNINRKYLSLAKPK